MKKIICSCILNSQNELQTREFLERVHDYEGLFKALFEQPIINAMGADKCAVEFIQYSLYTDTFILFADLYIDDESFFNPNVRELEIGLKSLKDIGFRCSRRGSYSDFLSRYQR